MKVAFSIVCLVLVSVALAADHSVLVWNISPDPVDVQFGDAPSFSVAGLKWHNFVANESSYTVVVNQTESTTKNYSISDNSTLIIFNANANASELLQINEPGLVPATAHARFFHDASSAPSVDVYFGGVQAAKNLSFNEATNYTAIPYGSVDVKLTAVDDVNTTILSGTVNVNDGEVVTITVAPDDTLHALVESAPARAMVQLAVFTTEPLLSVLLDGRSDIFSPLPAFADLNGPQVPVVAGIAHTFVVMSNGTVLSNGSLDNLVQDGTYRVLLTSTKPVVVQDNFVMPTAAYLARVTYVNLFGSVLDLNLADTEHNETDAATVSSLAQQSVFPKGNPYGPFSLYVNGTVQNITAYPMKFDPNSGYTLIAYPGANGALAFEQYRDYHGAVNQTVFFRLIHAVFDGPAVDLWVNGTGPHVTNIKYGGAAGVSQYVNISMLLSDQDVELSLRPTGSNETIASASFHFDLYTNYTIAAVGSAKGINGSVPAGVALVQLADDNTYVENTPKVRFVNLVPDYNGTVNVTIGSAVATAFADTTALSASAYDYPSTGKKTITIQLAGGKTLTTKATLDAGSVYTVAIEGFVAANNTRAFIVRDLLGGDYEPGLTTLELFLLIGGGILFGIMLLTIIVFAIRSRGPEGYEQLPN